RRGRLHPEPRPEAARPLFPGITRRAARAAAERQRDRWRDRDRDRARSRLRRAANAAAPRRIARGEAREGDALELRGIRPPRLRWARPDACAAERAARAVGEAVCEARSAAPSHADDAGPEPRGTVARPVRGRGPGWRHAHGGVTHLLT